MNRPDPSKHHCPRCGETGDPRTCNCMRRLSRYIAEARLEIRLGRPTHGGGQLTEAERLLEFLALDAKKQARERPRAKGRR